MAKIFIAVALLLLGGMALLCVNILLRKNGTFRSEDVGASKAMQERGIHCFRAQDKIERRKRADIKEMMQ